MQLWGAWCSLVGVPLSLAADIESLQAPTSVCCSLLLQIQRPLPREEFAKLMYKSIGLKLPDTVLDILMHMFGDGQGSVDGPGLVAVMKHRNKVPGYKVSSTARYR